MSPTDLFWIVTTIVVLAALVAFNVGYYGAEMRRRHEAAKKPRRVPVDLDALDHRCGGSVLPYDVEREGL